MKHVKKLAGLLMALIMVFTLSTTAFAYTIGLEGDATSPVDGHTYSVYQIFTGDLSEGGNTLSNVKYGANYTGSGSAATGDLVPEAELKAITDGRAFAESLMANEHALLKGDAFGTLNEANEWKLTDVPAGYYLIVDEGVPAAGDSYSAYIIQVVDDVTMKPKSETIPVDKMITGDDNDIAGDIAEDEKSDNVSIGSKIEYTLTSKIPANAAKYDYFYFIIGDTLSEGLTFDAESVEVTIDGQTVAEGTDYTLFTGADADADGKTFQIALKDAIAHAGKAVVVTYSATLNEKAKIGAKDGNINDFDVVYSNNPNYDYDGTDTNQDGKPDEGKSVPTGVTPTITTRTYTTGIQLMKVDEEGKPLQGAEFQITGTNVKIVLVSEETFEVAEDGAYWKLKNGTYTTEAPQTADTYVEKPAGDRDGGYVLEDGVYREATDEELADESVTLYILIKANGDLYDSVTTKYNKTVVFHQEGAGQTETDVKAYVGADGLLTFVGLGEGEYTITETHTPDGYNTISPITVTIDWEAPATGSNDCTWTAIATVSGSQKTLALNADGVFELEVVNESGTLLPETGGTGTTILYIVGGALVLVAVVLLVTKKRMHANG